MKSLIALAGLPVYLKKLQIHKLPTEKSVKNPESEKLLSPVDFVY